MDWSRRSKSRLAGVFYAFNIVFGSLSLFFAGRGLSSYASAFNLAATACYVAVTLLFQQLFRSVSETLSVIAACLGLVGCGLGALAAVGISAGISPLALFGAYCVLIGFLILRSTFLPTVLGVLMIIGGLGWLTFLSRAVAVHLKPYNMLPGILGESALTVWLLAKGVNSEGGEPSPSAH